MFALFCLSTFDCLSHYKEPGVVNCSDKQDPMAPSKYVYKVEI